MHYNALIIWYSFDRQQTPPGSSTSLSIFLQHVGFPWGAAQKLFIFCGRGGSWGGSGGCKNVQLHFHTEMMLPYVLADSVDATSGWGGEV
jgi:hypothetical protein